MKLFEFRQIIDEYFSECERLEIFPDEAGMALRLGLERGQIDTLLASTDRRRAGYRRAILDARLRRESVLVRGIYASEKSTSGKIFLSRQGSAGGLSDKNASGGGAGDVFVEVKISGIPDCFD